MPIIRTLSESLAPVVDLIYPPRCPLCGEGIAAQTGLCSECWSKLEVPKEDGDQSVVAATLYNDASRDLVLAYKHGRKLALAPMLARLMAARLPVDDKQRLIVPVPLHRWRMWQRGFNQSALLARELAKLTRAPLMVDGLIRRKSTRSLGGLGARERKAELAGAIAVARKRAEAISGADILLVDDVLTSGATSDVCKAALMAGGARSVKLACFARRAAL